MAELAAPSKCDLRRDLSTRTMPREEQRRLGVDQQQRRREDVLAPCRVLPQGGRGGGSASSTAPAIVPPLEAEGNASTDDKRQRQARCNVDITLRQEEAIRRLQSLREAQLASKERERLKRQWRAHKAQGYLLAQCKDAELRGYLASKPKPPLLPRLSAALAPEARRAQSR
eukprot:CAMPEP_0180802720 /NCGR_PEP_ID=MMETSP1038_2-20121128/60470_1 /TAXON_ID=632150 /ORGANISM="Azadinium spinosum, Strain 3D9" /LENGTH=170 /DNA_ID=CAMNT_0022842899 /DNA_START=1 /DNA_END=510 /DNA_ORIENTATION=-